MVDSAAFVVTVHPVDLEASADCFVKAAETVDLVTDSFAEAVDYFAFAVDSD